MAATYINLAAGVLIGIALLLFVVGFTIGRSARAAAKGDAVVTTLAVLILCGLVFGMFKLPVSGPLIIRLILALIVETEGALLAGFLSGAYLRRQNLPYAKKMLCLLGMPVLLAVGYQIINLKAVAETLETAGVLKPRDEYKPETNKTCPENLKGLYNAFAQYAELNDSLPSADKWEENTDFTSRVPQDAWLHCPVVSNGHDDKFGYAYNAALSGKKLNLNGKPLNTFPDAAKTPLLYDSTNLSKNAQDGVASLPKPGRHSGRNNILYLDGHVEAVAPK